MKNSFFEALVNWYEKAHEEYWFRQDRNPYKVWISEVALQQTRIQAALDPLQRFFGNFPTLKKLANAEEETVLHAFRGLGYYSRSAKFAQRCSIYLEIL